jgi:ketosteroid isomerase-like protein
LHEGEILRVVSEGNVEVVRAFVEAYNEGDVDRLEALCTDDPEIAGIRAALEETKYAGSGAVRRYWADATEVWSERRIDVEEIDARSDDTVVVRALWHGRGRASGIDVERRLSFRFRLQTGRVASFQTLINPEDAG